MTAANDAEKTWSRAMPPASTSDCRPSDSD